MLYKQLVSYHTFRFSVCMIMKSRNDEVGASSIFNLGQIAPEPLGPGVSIPQNIPETRGGSEARWQTPTIPPTIRKGFLEPISSW